MFHKSDAFFRLTTIFSALCLLLSALLAGPGTAGAFTVGEERELGEKLLAMVRREFRLLDDPDIQQYVNRLGAGIIKVAGLQYFDYHFFIINNKEFNAFAAPSGLVFVHSGLIEAMDTEAELIGVMAHECGHVVSRHIARRMEKSTKVNIGTMALMIAGMALGAGALSEALITGSMAANASLNLKFSRADEEQADRLAYKWMRAEDRDPGAMVDMLGKMYKVSRVTMGTVPPYLLSHPEPDVRMNYVRDLIASDGVRHYPEEDEFDFRRIRYRILTATKDPGVMLPVLLKEVAADKGGDGALMSYYGLSQVYLRNADFAGSEAALRKVMARWPDKSVLGVDLGVIYFTAGRYAQALELFKRAAQADPDSAYASYYLAMALEQTGDREKALAIYTDLLSVMPDYSKLYYRIGRIEAAKGRTGAGYYYLGLYYWYEGDTDNAKTYLQRVKNDPAAPAGIKDKAGRMLAKIDRLEKL